MQEDLSLQYVLEIRNHNFKSQREPRSYGELVCAARSLMNSQSLILGSSSAFSQSSSKLALLCMDSLVNIDCENTFQQMKMGLWQKQAEKPVYIRIISALPATPVSRPVGIPLEYYQVQAEDKNILEYVFKDVVGGHEMKLMAAENGLKLEDIDNQSFCSDLDEEPQEPMQHQEPESNRANETVHTDYDAINFEGSPSRRI